jgi:hypothetical protein
VFAKRAVAADAGTILTTVLASGAIETTRSVAEGEYLAVNPGGER